jgi:hypothetical protein
LQSPIWNDENDSRSAAKTNPIVATKALGCKLAKAAWYLLKGGKRMRLVRRAKSSLSLTCLDAAENMMVCLR